MTWEIKEYRLKIVLDNFHPDAHIKFKTEESLVEFVKAHEHQWQSYTIEKVMYGTID